jgi:hypothetical protein
VRRALVLLVLLGSCARAASYEGPEGAPKVYVVGDSLVVESEDALRSTFPGDRVAVTAERGKGTSWAADRLRRQVRGDEPDVAVVAIGTNDWTGGWDERDADAVDDVLRTLDGVACAVWVLPAARFADIGGHIAEAAAAHPRVHVARWDEASTGHADWYQPDGIHHTAAGNLAYAAFIHDARVTSCPS